MHDRIANFGGLREPVAPRPGDLFRVSDTDVRTVDLLELSAWTDGALTTFLVRDQQGERWTLVPRDPVLDGIPFHGTPAPRATD